MTVPLRISTIPVTATTRAISPRKAFSSVSGKATLHGSLMVLALMRISNKNSKGFWLLSYHQPYSSAEQYVVCQEYSHSTRAGIFGTENNYKVTRHTGYGSMQLNYHEGANLSSLGNTLFGGYWIGNYANNVRDGLGLFYLWHHNDINRFSYFGSLSQ